MLLLNNIAVVSALLPMLVVALPFGNGTAKHGCLAEHVMLNGTRQGHFWHHNHSSSGSIELVSTSATAQDLSTAAPSMRASHSTTAEFIPSTSSSSSIAISEVQTVSATSSRSITPVTTTASTTSTSLAASTTTTTSGSPSSDQQAWIDAHNVARAAYGAGKVTWDDGAAASAQANFDAHKGSCALIHTVNGSYGQNLAGGSADASTVTASDVVGLWMGEASEYDYNNPEALVALHFTEVVWKGVKAVGCVLGSCDSGGWLAVCDYFPPGNYIGEFAANVGEPLA